MGKPPTHNTQHTQAEVAVEKPAEAPPKKEEEEEKGEEEKKVVEEQQQQHKEEEEEKPKKRTATTAKAMPHFMSPRESTAAREAAGEDKESERKDTTPRKPPMRFPHPKRQDRAEQAATAAATAPQPARKPKPKPKQQQQEGEEDKQKEEAREFGCATKLTKICQIRQELAVQQIDEARKRAAERKTWAATGKVDHTKLYRTPVNVYQPIAYFEEQQRTARKTGGGEGSEAGSDGTRTPVKSSGGTGSGAPKWIPSSV
jgi:hypothetical protein